MKILFTIALLCLSTLAFGQGQNFPNGGSGGGGTPGAPSGSIQYNNGGSFGGDTALSTNGAGALTDTQGTLTTSNPFMSHTVTFNAGAVAFTNFLDSITCTAAATASIAAGWGVGATQWQMKYGAANCGTPQFLIPTGTSAAPSISTSANPASGFAQFGNTTALINNGVGVLAVRGTANATLDGSLGFANVDAFNNNGDSFISRLAAGTLTVGQSAAPGSETGLFRPGAMACRITSAITGGATTNVCSWSLPASAQTWAYKCDLLWQVSAGTSATLSLGINASQAPTSETAMATILTTNTGTQTNGSVTATASGNQNILTTAALTNSATNFQAQVAGTVQASATAGTFAVTFTLGGTTPTGQISPGSSCLLY